MGKARNKLSGLALSEWRAKHPFDPATGRFMSKGGGISAPSAPDVPSAPTPGRARARLGLASKVDMAAALETLRAKKASPQRGDSAAVDAILGPMSHAQLDEVGREFGVAGVRGTKQDKINTLTQRLVGHRLGVEAIMRTKVGASIWEQGLSAPDAPSPTAARQARSARKALASNPSSTTDLVARMREEERRGSGGETSAPAKRGRARAALSGQPNVLVDQHQADLQRQLEALVEDSDGVQKGEAMLSGLTLPALRDLATKIGPTAKLPSKVTKAEAIRRIVEGTIGFRQRAEAVGPGVAARRAADRLAEAAPSPAAPTPAPKPRKAASALQAATPTARPATPGSSPNALLRNSWGGTPRPDSVHFHPDGAIGMALDNMGDNRHMEIEGDALGNVLGRIATDTVLGRVSAQEQVNRLKAIRDQVPLGSHARRELQTMVDRLDVPRIDLGEWGRDVEPVLARFPVLRELAQRLEAVPLARGADIPGDHADTRELDGLHEALARFGQGTLGGGRFIDAIERLDNRRHESREGKLEIDRAVQRAVEQLRQMQRADRTQFYPNTPGKA